MGLGNNQSSRTYIKIKDGAVIIQCKAEDRERFQKFENFASKVAELKNKEGVEICEYYFGHLTGRLSDISIVEKAFNGGKPIKQWQVTFTDDNEGIYVWNTYYDGYMFQNFVNCLLSVSGEYGVFKLQPWNGKDKKGNLQTKLTIYHNGDGKENKLGWKYSPEELPAVTPLKDEDGNVMTKTDGSIIYNEKKRIRWLLESVDLITKKIKESNIHPEHRQTNSNQNDDLDDKF